MGEQHPAAPGRVLLVQPRAPRENDWLSMTRYTAGLAEVLAPVSRVDVVSAAHVNMPRPFRRYFQRYRGFPSLPYRWRDPVDLVHFTDPYVAVHQGRFRRPRVVTIHDMITLDYVPWFPPGYGVWRGIFVRSLSAIRHVDAVVTPSEYTRLQLIERTGLSPDRIRTVPVLVPDSIHPADDESGRLQGAILSIGTGARYKNLPLLLHALARPELKGSRLIRVGQPMFPSALELADRLGIAGRIEYRGLLPDEELTRALQTATVLAQPSLTEGFGMPVAEAMAAGTPVVTSNGGALPEVAGAAGRVVPLRQLTYRPQVNDDDVRDFALALAEVLDTPALQASMRERGLREAERFRAPAVRAALLNVYESARRTAAER